MEKSGRKSTLLLREGLFQAKFAHQNGPIYLRMELLTEENTLKWQNFKEATIHLIHQGFSSMVEKAGWLNYEDFNAHYEGFTLEEYLIFQQESRCAVKKTNRKVLSILNGIVSGACGFHPELSSDKKFVVYATSDPNFVLPLGQKQCNFIQYKNFYKDILITVVSNHAKEEQKYFSNRGIFRPPHQVLNNRYDRLAILLHGFSGAIGAILSKTRFTVKPLPSMQDLLCAALERDEGFLMVEREIPLPIVVPLGGFKDEFEEGDAILESRCQKIDIKDFYKYFKVENKLLQKESPENIIQNSALIRLYGQS